MRRASTAFMVAPPPVPAPGRRFQLLLGFVFLGLGNLVAAPADDLFREAVAAEARLDTPEALRLFLAADQARPDDARILQKIARQYSDSEVDATDPNEKRRLAQLALEFSRRAETLDPRDPVNVLSVAISYGKLAALEDIRTRVNYSRLVKQGAEHALALDPDYDWAHHVLGRWHLEVSSLGAASRVIVRLVYGGLPAASPESAVAHLQQAVALAPATVAHHLQLGFALLAAGHPAEARAAFAHGLALPSREKHDEAAKAEARTALAKLGPKLEK
jgi:hypothetical protein